MTDPLFGLFVVGILVVALGSFAIFAGLLTFWAWRDPPALRVYRIQRMRPAEGSAMVGRAARMWILNHLLLFGALAAAWPVLRHTGVHAGALPAWWVVLGQVVAFVYLDDLIQYFWNRALHRAPGFLGRMHRWHHRNATPWAICAHDLHPLDFLITTLLALMVPVLIGAHVATIWIWVALRQILIAEAHSGYDFPLAVSRLIPFHRGAAHHDFHHAQRDGNYAGFMPHADGWFGTLARHYADYRARRSRR